MNPVLIDGVLWIPKRWESPVAIGDEMVVLEQSDPEYDEWLAELAPYEPWAEVAAGWDESEHPRHPAGTPVEGGRFAPKGEEMFVSEPEEEFGAVLEGMVAMDRLWADQTQEGLDHSDTIPNKRYALDESASAKVMVQDKIAAKLEGDEDFKSLIAALDPTGEWKTEFEPGGVMETATTVEQQVAALAVKNWSISSGDHDIAALQFQMAAEAEFGLAENPFVHDAWRTVTEHFDQDYGDLAKEDLEAAMRRMGVFNQQQHAGARKFLRAQYELTQEMFEEAGIESVIAYRGMKFDSRTSLTPPPREIGQSLQQGVLDWEKDRKTWETEANAKEGMPGRPPKLSDYPGQAVMSIHQNPLSSWAHTFYAASSFADGGVVGAVAGTKIDRRRILSTPFTGFGCLDETELVVLGDKDMDAMVWSWEGEMARPEGDKDFYDAWTGVRKAKK